MRGGLRLPSHKPGAPDLSIENASVPERLFFTVRDPDHSANVLVKVGESIAKGQPLARGSTQIVHASVSGKISAIDRDSMAVNIAVDNDGLDKLHSDVKPIANADALSPAELREHIAGAGIVGLGGAGFRTAAKLNAAAERTELLLVNGAECEPFITCDDALMRAQADDIVFGTRLLMRASGAAQAVIAIESDKTAAAAAIAHALDQAKESSIRVRIVDTYYPAGGENQLIKTIADREVPSGEMPSDIGVLCQNVGTAAAIALLAKTGQPLIERIVSITGHGVRTPRHLRARFGTPIASLIADCGGYTDDIARVIMGGSMMGTAVPDDAAPVTAATNCIVAATATDLLPRGAELPCIRCGECAHACPAYLLPQQLLRYARLQDRAALDELGLRDCIECGCCDYVCPSQIRITDELRGAKRFTASMQQKAAT